MNFKHPLFSADVLRQHGRSLAFVGAIGVLGVGGMKAIETFRPASEAEPVVEDVVTAETEPAYRAGLATTDWDLPNLEHERVDFWVHRFTTDPDMREKFEGFLHRSGLYKDMISRSLAERNMPQDLIFLAMIESGFQAHAYSTAAASGLWQFIAETGKRYGLRVDAEVDERNDPERATVAALDYLEELHERFNSWYLAAAAYNTGENRVGRIMREETGSERARSERDYYRIWDRLPRETRDYVPLMIAAARIAKDPASYGFDHVEPRQPLEYEVTVTDAQLTLEEVAKAAGAQPEDVRLLNAHLKSGRLPAGERFALRLPAGTREAFESNWVAFAGEEGLEHADVLDVTRYQVRRGDNLTVIARRHGVSVDDIRRSNSLRGSRIYAGQVLEIAAR